MRGRPRKTHPDHLTPTEIEVLLLAAKGHSDRAIGDKICVASTTASWHICNILRKLEARNRVHAYHIALLRGLVPAPRYQCEHCQATVEAGKRICADCSARLLAWKPERAITHA